MNDSKTNNSPTTKPKDIDLFELFLKIWSNRKKVIKGFIIGGIVGIIIAFSIPKEYTTKVLLAPETTAKNIGGSLSSLASLAGLNLGNLNNEDAISPELYPKIVSSIPFLTDLFAAQVVTKKGNLHTDLYTYMENHQKNSWWNYFIIIPKKGLDYIASLLKEKDTYTGGSTVDPFRLTLKQALVADNLDKRIKSSIDKKTGVISISVKMQDALISATVADSVKNILQKYITDYRTSKARKDLNFAQNLYTDAQNEYLEAQKKYATFTDGNMNIVLARYKAEEERLKNEMNLSYSVYNQVAQQLQISKAKLQEITPVYTVIQPATVPLISDGPTKIVFLALFIFLGGIFSILWIVGKDWYLRKLKEIKQSISKN